MTRRVWPALLFALLLPLQSFAFMGGCGSHHTEAAAHCSHHAPDAQDPGTAHHCGACCCMATAASPAVAWHAALWSRAGLSLPSPPSRLAPTLDRLDRPPRLAAA